MDKINSLPEETIGYKYRKINLCQKDIANVMFVYRTG